MSKVILTAKALNLIIANADEKTDFKKQLGEALEALKYNEELIITIQNEAALSVTENTSLKTAAVTAASEITALKAQIESDGDIIVQLRAENATALSEKQVLVTEIEALKGEAGTEDFKALLAEKDQELEDALKLVTDLGAQLDVQQANGGGAIIVTVDGTFKKLVGNRFHFKGEAPMDALALSKRPELLQAMSDSKSGALVDTETVIKDDSDIIAGVED
jgi:hypothetical protein